MRPQPHHEQRHDHGEGQSRARQPDARLERQQRARGEQRGGQRDDVLPEGQLVFAFVEVEVAAVLGFVEHFTRFVQNARGKRAARFDRPFLGEKVQLVPVFPRLERFALDVRGKPHAEALLDVQPGDQHASTARKERTVFPQCSVARVVMPADLYPVDRPASPERTSL